MNDRDPPNGHAPIEADGRLEWRTPVLRRMPAAEAQTGHHLKSKERHDGLHLS